MTRSHGTKLNTNVSKLYIGTSKTMHLLLFWKSHCATCSPVYVILYHVNGSCKGSIAFTKSNAILYNYIHITQLPSTRHVYALADLFFSVTFRYYVHQQHCLFKCFLLLYLLTFNSKAPILVSFAVHGWSFIVLRTACQLWKNPFKKV